MKPVIRPFVLDDLGEVMNIEIDSYSDPWPEDAFQSELENRGVNHAHVAVHKDTGEVVGYCFFWILEEDEIHINNIAVHPSYRRRGIALELIRDAIDSGRPHRIKSVTLEVREGNTAARTFYEKLGFAQVGRRPKYYLKPKEDALILRLMLPDWEAREKKLSRTKKPTS